MVVNFSRHRVAKETKHAKNSVKAALTQVQVVTTVMVIIDKFRAILSTMHVVWMS